jgi:hypothetical protein
MADPSFYNWEGRSVQSFGPKFRIDLANPQMGFNGSDVYNIYAVSNNNDVCLAGLTEGGTYRIYNDKAIEIVAGDSNSATPGVDIVITGKNGDVCITAESNGRVRIKAQNIMIEADEDIDMKAGRNINLNSGSGRVLLKGNKIDATGLTGNLIPKGLSFGLSVFSGSFVGIDVLESAFTVVEAVVGGV